MKTVILHNIVSSNTVYKINSYIDKHKKELGNTEVWFSSQTESNRKWKLQEKPKFKYKILPNFSIKLEGKDLFTYFINPSIIKELKRLNPDRIIICGWDIFMYQASFVWGYINKKHITLWSGSTVNETSWRRDITKPVVKLFIKLSTDFIAYGTKAKEYLISLGADKNKVEIFINDVNRKYFINQSKKLQSKRQVIKDKYGIKTNKNLIFVGQLIERKGILDLLEAYKIFKKTHPQWGLIIVGYGQLDLRVKQIIKQEKLKNVYCLGFIEQYDLPQFYAVSNVLVLPSHEEVWGLVVNEALYSGLKAIVGDKCGCAVDLITSSQKGYIFKSGSVKSLILSLCKNN